MAYKIQFTNNSNNAPLVVNDNTINTQTSLAFPGRNVVGFSTIIGEDFLHLLENFSNSSSPSNPVEGQLWYDNSEGSTQLRIYDGLNWNPAGSVNKSAAAPNSGSAGDLWIDTLHQQLYLYSGTNWVLVGPTFSSGLKSGLQVEIVLDSLGIEKTILATYVNDQIISIYSTTFFIPKVTISGFSTIKPGINVTSNNFSDGTVTTKLWGTAEKAESLIVNGTTVSASNFLRSDSDGLTNFPILVKSDTGISVGTENQLKLQLSGSVGTIYHSTSQSALDLKVNFGGQATTLLRLDATTGNVGINNLNPQATLDVTGSARISGDVHITSTTDSLTSSTGALIVDGGVTIQGNVNLNSDTFNSGTLWLNYGEGLSQSGGPYPGLMPTTDSNINLGGADSTKGYYPFNTIYANKFIAANQGSFVGNLTGSISGNSISASKLQASTTFNMDGDVSSNGFSFDGLTGGTSYAIDISTGTNGFISKTGSGPYFVQFAIVLQSVKPPVGINYIVTGNNNPSYNGSYVSTGSTSTSITLSYTSNPGVYGSGTTTITSSAGLVKTFRTQLASSLISSKEEVTDSSDSDVLLIYRPSAGLRKTTKPNFVKSLPLVPVGSIFPFAGQRDKVPLGYLLCDGSEQEQAKYLDLFTVIGYTYGDPLKLKGRYSFKIPDLRGRFALGLDNMDNGNTVNTINGAQKTITTPANVVTDAAAKTIGNTGGRQSVILDTNNLPPHQHKLTGDKGTQFYALNASATTPTDSGASKNFGVGSNGQRIDRTGDILFGPTTAQPLTVMNPFMSINYIIYAGKVYTS
jgi:microcystin-dependent protein